jgi:hypothetical protein
MNGTIRMKTRSQTKPIELTAPNFVLYEVNIDFDEASREWQSNKKSIGNSSYKYVCQKVGNTGKMCRSKCLAGQHYCSKHI